ncbi:MAG: hypothetical protein ACOX0E_09280 [Syntrophomonadaceae bacterium]
MFFTFVNKHAPHCVDLSVLKKVRPYDLLFYYYNSFLEIPLSAYFELSQTIEKESAPLSAQEWFDMLQEEIESKENLLSFAANPYLDKIGPYYFPKTNTQFYFTKKVPPKDQLVCAEDLNHLRTLDKIPPLDRELQAYYKSRKNGKKAARNKNELLKDVQMCICCLEKTEKLNRHLNYLNKLLEGRYAIVEQEELFPPEPDTLPEKPAKQEEANSTLNNLIPFRSRRKDKETDGNSFNHDIKVYYIRYREYEKACDRYKKALETWEEDCRNFIDDCWMDIDVAEEKLQEINRSLDIYNGIITKSFIHFDYQDINTLKTFKTYLETGRANDLQECMNLFEEERLWSEIKASQERIENTIHFLKNSEENSEFIEEQINRIINGSEKVSFASGPRLV